MSAQVELHDEVVTWMLRLVDSEWDRVVVIVDRLSVLGPAAELRFSLGSMARRITYRFTQDGRIVLLTTFRKQRQNERVEVARARQVAEVCARRYP